MTSHTARAAASLLAAASAVMLVPADRLSAAELYDGPNLLIIEWSGGYVADDADLARRVAGEQPIDDDLILAAFCNNGVDWLDDYSLNTDIVIATDPGAVKAAAMYAAAVERDDLRSAAHIAGYEQAFWRADADLSVVDEWIATLGAAEAGAARKYFDERAEPPSEDDAERYVISVVNATTTIQKAVYLDAARLGPDSLRRARLARGGGPVVVGDAEEPLVLGFADCADLAERWDRFDGDLPPLPPVDERVLRDP